jgi:uncharacterized Tic20 family protein
MTSYPPRSPHRWLYAQEGRTLGQEGRPGPGPAEPADPAGHTLQAHHEYAPAGGGPDGAPGPGQPAGHDELWAMLGYLGVIFLGFLAPLAIYLAKRRSRYVRYHAAQSLNLSVTGTLFNLSALILGGILALDKVTVALVIVLPLAAALWLTTLAYLIRAAIAANRGEHLDLPGWLCVPMIK